MAITKIWMIKSNAKNTINYVGNKDKTQNEDNSDLDDALTYLNHDTVSEEKHFVTGINCTPIYAYEEMISTKQRYNKLDGSQAFHAVQSFLPGEVSPSLAHEIGIKLAKELWGDRFEVVVATHVNKQHIHSHFVINSVSFSDGKRYYDNKNTYQELRNASDKLCQEYGLRVIDPSGKGKPYYAWKDEPNKRKLIVGDVEAALENARTMNMFINHLKKQGYEVKQGKHIAIKPSWSKKYFRLYKLQGDKYSDENIINRILENDTIKAVTFSYATYPKKEANKLTGFQKLYFKYMYLLGILPKGSKRKNIYPHLQGDLRYMDEITKQATLLEKYGINSSDDLNAYKKQIQEQITFITNNRKSMYGKVKRCRNEQLKEDYQKDIKAYTDELSELKRELKLCESIEQRAVSIQNKVLLCEEHERNQEQQNKQTKEQVK